jgi:hypothetical protein
MTRRWIEFVVGIALVAALAWGVTFALDRLLVEPPPPAASASEAPPPAQVAHITATLFVAAEDGLSLQPVRREVPFADGVLAQGRQILLQQLTAPPRPYRSVIPPGTTLRAFFITDRGDAYVDLSGDAASAHPGGAVNELLTVQAIVRAVTDNLSAVQRVQILVDGKTVDSLAGHLDLREPLVRDPAVLNSSRPR